MGETEIDEGTYSEYIGELRDHYAPEKACCPTLIPSLGNSDASLLHRVQYHLLDFNCNHFSNDVIGFLTGGSIPPHIKGALAAPFLSIQFFVPEKRLPFSS